LNKRPSFGKGQLIVSVKYGNDLLIGKATVSENNIIGKLRSIVSDG
jgi:hypothetical protein